MVTKKTVHVGIDFHKRTSTLCFLEDGKEHYETIETKRLPVFLSNKKDLSIAIETTCGANHYVQILKDQGHQVSLIASGIFRGIGIGGKKTDHRDARALAIALKNNAIPEVHLKSLNARKIKSLVVCREESVSSRTRLICHIRGTLNEYGLTMPVGRENFEFQVRGIIEKLEDGYLKEILKQKLNRLQEIKAEIHTVDLAITELQKEDESIHRIKAIPGVGPMVAIMMKVLTEDIKRFKNAKHFTSYLGLVPSVSASANKRYMGRITRSGSELARRYLIHGARAAMRYNPEDDKHLEWAKGIEAKRGTNKAVVALARRMASIIFAMIRDQSEYKGRKKKKYKAA